jgi:hypothetical protein
MQKIFIKDFIHLCLFINQNVEFATNNIKLVKDGFKLNCRKIEMNHDELINYLLLAK